MTEPLASDIVQAIQALGLRQVDELEKVWKEHIRDAYSRYSKGLLDRASLNRELTILNSARDTLRAASDKQLTEAFDQACQRLDELTQSIIDEEADSSSYLEQDPYFGYYNDISSESENFSNDDPHTGWYTNIKKKPVRKRARKSSTREDTAPSWHQTRVGNTVCLMQIADDYKWILNCKLTLPYASAIYLEEASICLESALQSLEADPSVYNRIKAINIDIDSSSQSEQSAIDYSDLSPIQSVINNNALTSKYLYEGWYRDLSLTVVNQKTIEQWTRSSSGANSSISFQRSFETFNTSLIILNVIMFVIVFSGSPPGISLYLRLVAGIYMLILGSGRLFRYSPRYINNIACVNTSLFTSSAICGSLRLLMSTSQNYSVFTEVGVVCAIFTAVTWLVISGLHTDCKLYIYFISASLWLLFTSFMRTAGALS